jgi:hypothetical protein
MKKWWVGYLLALFALLWAKLPGPSAQDEPDPSREFRFKRKGIAGKDMVFEVSTEAAELPWLSERITGITIQKVKTRPDERYVTDEAPLQSRVKVTVTSPRTAELHNLRPEVREQLLSGTGRHAIVIGSVKEERFDKQEEMIVEGKGQGIWRILRRK